jgi:hypothetical protein
MVNVGRIGKTWHTIKGSRINEHIVGTSAKRRDEPLPQTKSSAYQLPSG